MDELWKCKFELIKHVIDLLYNKIHLPYLQGGMQPTSTSMFMLITCIPRS